MAVGLSHHVPVASMQQFKTPFIVFVIDGQLHIRWLKSLGDRYQSRITQHRRCGYQFPLNHNGSVHRHRRAGWSRFALVLLPPAGRNNSSRSHVVCQRGIEFNAHGGTDFNSGCAPGNLNGRLVADDRYQTCFHSMLSQSFKMPQCLHHRRRNIPCGFHSHAFAGHDSRQSQAVEVFCHQFQFFAA